jgi:hypothetical protein
LRMPPGLDSDIAAYAALSRAREKKRIGIVIAGATALLVGIVLFLLLSGPTSP